MQDSVKDDPFGDDHGFLMYVDAHCRTPRCLFHIDHIERFAKLAGGEINRADWRGEWFSMDQEFCEPFLKRAFARLSVAEPA
ncbi:hypothetical protein CcrC1_gp339 [Caulobacter phage C1]|nr:hypothetical protein CcrC1_gp339 [Caulobacter phage C1]UTU08568.1 hypothetical protein CcrC2_gp340 [Caulobacter phage C2]UTU09084.1 hypothetical protein CcrJ4_gp335 [Caulobacter phage J4]UTU09643.1 hypothetical protein CcrBL47_gp357 [Caulobacter phage BL47]UTU10201.1 hypothetical protein CcrRB23_gp339 [Caulobacter phage RB23]WGN97235.1 hypothetical protein [Bertelyvirus sp.]